jgi:hypothetical protein
MVETLLLLVAWLLEAWLVLLVAWLLLLAAVGGG